MEELLQLSDKYPLKFTTNALEAIRRALEGDPTLSPTAFLRILVKGGGCMGYQNEMRFDDIFDEEDDIKKEFSVNDKVLDIVIDSFSAMYLNDVTIDYITNSSEEGFKFTGGSEIKSTCGCGKSFSA